MTEVIFEAISPGATDYSSVVDDLRARGVGVLYYAGYAAEAGLIIRQARDSGYPLQLVAGDGIGTEDFALIAGPAAEGTLTSNTGVAFPEAAGLIAELRSETFEPDQNTIFSYAAIQVWAQAVEQAGSFDTHAVANALHANQFDTVLGRIGFDAKGDVYAYEPFTWYVWQEGKYVPLESGAGKE